MHPEGRQRTLSIVKPDGVRKGVIGEVIRRFERAGIRVVAMRMLRLTRKEAEGFYAVHRERPFFGSLTDFMSSGPVVVMVLEGEDSSGEHQGQRRLTKRGRPGLRRILYMAALRLLKRGAPLHGYYHRLRARLAGTPAVVAVMRKLLRVVHALVHSGQAYDALRLAA